MSSRTGRRGLRIGRRALLGAAAIGAVGLSACGPGGAPPASSGGEVVLYFRDADEPGVLGTMLPAFEQSHPGLRVVATPPGSTGDAQVVTALLQGRGPDVLWGGALPAYLQQPLLADLGPVAASRGYPLGAFPPGQLLAFRRGAALYGLPRTCNPTLYAGRTDVFADAGVAPPDGPYTAAELAALWRRLTIPGRRAGGELLFSPSATFYLNGWGAHLVDPADDLRSALGSAGAVACGEWIWQRFWLDGSARGVQEENGWAAFGSGTLAMVTLPAQALADAVVLYAGLPWRVMPQPVWPAGPATSTAGEFYGIAANTRHLEAAWELLAFVTSAGWGQAAIASALLCPARTALWPAYLSAIRVRFPPLTAQPLELYTEAVRSGAVFAPEAFRYQPPAAALLGQYFQEIFAPGHTLPVRRGFQAAALALNRLELRQAAAAQR